MLDILFFQSCPAEIWQMLVLLHELFEVVEVKIRIHQIAKWLHASHVNGVHFRVYCLCMLVVLLLPILEDVDQFLPPRRVVVRVELAHNVGRHLIPEVANGTSASISIVVRIVGNDVFDSVLCESVVASSLPEHRPNETLFVGCTKIDRYFRFEIV